MEDAVKLSILYPDTFNLPDLSTFKIGSVVKICVSGVRYWVKVVSYENGIITADDGSTFQLHHIFDIQE